MGDPTSGLDNSAGIQLVGKIMVASIIILFLVVALVAFLHLYANWFWFPLRDGSLHTSRSGSRSRRRRFEFAPDQPDTILPLQRRKGLDPLLLKSLPIITYDPQQFKDGLECSVCLSELSDGEKARLLPKCNHSFHVECIDMWFHSNSTCPLCRLQVDSTTAVTTTPQNPFENSTVFPTNVLFWGNQTRVTSGVHPLPSPRPSLALQLSIDIPRLQVSENVLAEEEEEVKSPLTTTLRSLKRLLSRDKRVVMPSTPTSSGDIERGQTSSKSTTTDHL